MTRVLIADGSTAGCELMTYILGSDPQIEILGCTSTGLEALRMAEQDRPDVIVISLHSPGMDGIETTRMIMQKAPTPIVIVSGADDHDDGSAAVRAIEAGALVLVKRPFCLNNDDDQATSNALIRAVKSMAEVKVVRRWAKKGGGASTTTDKPSLRSDVRQPKLVVIGTSTGGPAALREILEQIPASFPLPIAIVQHMAHGFLGGFAHWLSSSTGFPIKIAENGMQLQAGHAYLAPDGRQMGVGKDLRVSLVSAPAEHGMCPSVSYLFRSLHSDLCPYTIAVLLTGMGKDGALELKQLKDAGAITIAQDQASSAVHGMPGEAIKLDAAMMIISAPDIGKTLIALSRNGNEQRADMTTEKTDD